MGSAAPGRLKSRAFKKHYLDLLEIFDFGPYYSRPLRDYIIFVIFSRIPGFLSKSKTRQVQQDQKSFSCFMFHDSLIAGGSGSLNHKVFIASRHVTGR